MAAVPERIRWAVELLAPAPDERLLEIGCGPGVAVSAVCERLAGGRIVAIDRSATAIGRAERRNADHVAAGRAVLLKVALEEAAPSELLRGRERFGKVFAFNVNLFWVRRPAAELDLIRRLLAPDGALYLFYGYGGTAGPQRAGRTVAGVPGALLDHLTAGGFAAEVRQGPAVVAVVATPR
jgi:SAM-dependent methyltransferase